LAADKDALYQEAILQHARAPCGYGEPPALQDRERGDNALCGDAVELFLAPGLDGGRRTLGFRSEGCLLCKASASMLAALVGADGFGAAVRLAPLVVRAFGVGAPPEPALEEHPLLAPLAAMRAFPARGRCVTLAWETFLLLMRRQPGGLAAAPGAKE
jgi:nitrogen fixation NifU-like protein